MGYIQTNKNMLSVMYAFEYLLEMALKELNSIIPDDVILCFRF